jgi:lysophospholipase L1-like esterase
VRPVPIDPKLPNVLLLGDSITRNYFPEVQRQLRAAANVYLMATSASVGDPRLLRQLTDYSTAEPIAFSVVHFNNGMHGWAYSETEYREAFSKLISALHSMAPGAALVWATTTPVQKESEPGPTNARINARNNFAQSFIRADGIVVDDQHGLMAQHSDLYLDGVHYGDQGSILQGKQAAEAIRRLLPHSEQ